MSPIDEAWETQQTGEILDQCPHCPLPSAWVMDTAPPPTMIPLPKHCARVRCGWWWYCASLRQTFIDHDKMPG